MSTYDDWKTTDAHPATGTTCTRCGQVIQSVLPAFPPVATVDGWRHDRCPEVPPEPVPVEVDRQGNPRVYPCADCGTMRSLPEGGTTFTVCDECWDKRYPKASASPPAAPASEPAPTCSVPCLSRTCPRTCELGLGHPPDRDHSHASRPNEAGHTWPASEPAVRPFNRIASLEAELARIYTYATDRAEMAEMAKCGLETTEGCLNDALAREARIEAEVEQLRGKLAEEREDGRAERVMLLERLDQATARVRSMRETAAKVALEVRNNAQDMGWEEDADVADGIAAVIRALPLDTGTATDTGGEDGK